MLWPWLWLLRHRRRRREAESAERAGPGEASPGAGPQPGADASCALCPGTPGHPESGAGPVYCAGVGLGGPGVLLSSSSVPLAEVETGVPFAADPQDGYRPVPSPQLGGSGPNPGQERMRGQGKNGFRGVIEPHPAP